MRVSLIIATVIALPVLLLSSNSNAHAEPAIRHEAMR